MESCQVWKQIEMKKILQTEMMPLKMKCVCKAGEEFVFIGKENDVSNKKIFAFSYSNFCRLSMVSI